MDQKDWHDDVVLTERSAALAPRQRRQAAALALWRLRAPLFELAMDAEWGIDLSVLESLFQSAASAPGEQSNHRYRQAIVELCDAPLFTSEVDPEARELVQLETIARLLIFGEELEEAGPDKIEYIIDCPRGLADYLDGKVEDSFYSHPSQDDHRQYLATLAGPIRSYGLGYLASRNLTIEYACHDAVQSLPPTEGLLDTCAGRDLIALCEDFSGELVAMLRWLNTTGY